MESSPSIRGWNLVAVWIPTTLGACNSFEPRSPRGSQRPRCTDAHTRYGCEHYEVQISMAAQGTPEENGYAERLCYIKERRWIFEYNDCVHTGDWTLLEDVYNTKRISAPGTDTGEFEAACDGPTGRLPLTNIKRLARFLGPLQHEEFAPLLGLRYVLIFIG